MVVEQLGRIKNSANFLSNIFDYHHLLYSLRVTGHKEKEEIYKWGRIDF